MPTPNTRLALLRLDDRLVPSISVVNNELRVVGTDQPDIIVIERERGSVDDYFVTVYDRATARVRPGEPRREFDEQDFRTVFVDGRGGGDVLVNWTNYRSTLQGGEGDDYLQGGFSDDTLAGGVGSDVYVQWALPTAPGVPIFDERPDPLRTLGVDTIREADNADADTVTFRDLGGPATFDAARTGFQEVASRRHFIVLESAAGVASGRGIENVIGTPFRDTLSGNERANTIDGGGENDTLAGRGGNDILVGGAGHDTLLGGAGNDTLSGNEGHDTLVGNEYSLFPLIEADTFLGGAGVDVNYFWMTNYPRPPVQVVWVD